MNRSSTRLLALGLLIAACFSLATVLAPRTAAWRATGHGDNVLEVLFGDGRRLFANHFFVQADVSFHNGYYPSIFDQKERPKDSRHMTEVATEGDHHEDHDHEEGHSEASHSNKVNKAHDHDHMDGGSCASCSTDPESQHMKDMALSAPRDWVERIGRKFIITEHTHAEEGAQREMLPWLKIAAELDPEKIENYTVAAYWLRDMKKYQEAEQFLRDGLRRNPNSYEILFELGRLYYKDLKDLPRARNILDLALLRWNQRNANREEPDFFALDQIAFNLAVLEESQTNYARSLELLELARKGSPNPAAVSQRIEEVKAKVAAGTNSSVEERK